MNTKLKTLILTSLLFFGLLSSTSAATTKTLYAWVKDQAGNVSNSLSANVDITLPAEPANTYYVSSSTGLDTNNGTSSSTPWKTIAKVNSQTFTPGASILFKKGDTWTGETITVSSSGNSTSPITYSSYGTGSQPVISGFTTITGWTNEGNGIYSKVISAQSAPNMVTVNDVNTAMGRWPNAGAASGGYLNIDSHVGSTSLTSSELNSAATNWTGGEVVLKRWHWVIDRGTITNHSGSTITFTGGSGELKDNYGYFIQNDIRTFDITGEWAYKSGKLYMYFGSNNPTNYIVKISTIDKNVYSTKSYINFSNLSFEGANIYGIQQLGGSYLTVLDSNIDYIGTTGIYINNSSDATIRGNNFTNINDNSFYSSSSSPDTYFGHNIVYNCAMIPGATASGDLHGFGVFLQGENETVEYNNISMMGYLGMYVSGNNMLVRYNFINSVCLVKDDGGGIYVNGYAQTIMSNRVIENNIITNAIGNGYGTTSNVSQAQGIYPDGYANNIIIRNNTVTKSNDAGIFLGFYSHDISVLNNILIDNTINLFHSDGDTIANNNIINGNVFTTTSTNDLVNLSMNTRPLSSFGTWSGNYYIKPFDDKSLLKIDYSYGTREEWDALSINGITTYDTTAHSSPVIITPYIINSLIGTNKFSNGSFTSNITGADFYYGGTAALTWDNTNKINGGSAKVSYTALSATRGHSQVKLSVGALKANTKYILKYDILGTSSNKVARVFLKYADYYTDRYKYQPYTNSVTHVEMLLEPNSAASMALLYFEFRDQDSTVYIDNVEFYEADVTKANPNDYILFDYNATTSNKTVSLGSSTYVDVTGATYTGSVTLLPYTSIVLIKTN